MNSPYKRLDFITGAAIRGVRDYYQQLGLAPTQIPEVTRITGACENVDTLYRLLGHPGLYLAQTGQLSLEVKLQQHDGVYCEAFSFRDDPSDIRHLNQFYLIEEEFTCRGVGVGENGDAPRAMLSKLLVRVTAAVCAILHGVLEYSKSCDDFDCSHIEQAISAAGKTGAWPSITYRESLNRLNNTKKFPTLAFGADLSAEHEQMILSLVSADHGSTALPVFVTHYPESIKFFNMKVDPEDQAVVLSADLLLPTAGESVGAAVREDQIATLVTRLESSSMMRHMEAQGGQPRRDFDRYLAVVAAGKIPLHAGYGIGLERVLQFILCSPDIRDVSEAYQLRQQLA
jgi:asparaginyl-tRNA synthetase